MTFDIRPCTESDHEKIRNFLKPAHDIISYVQYSGFAVCILVAWLMYGMQNEINLPPDMKFILVAVLFVMAIIQVFMFRQFILPSMVKRLEVKEKEVIAGNVVAYQKMTGKVTLDTGEAHNRVISLVNQIKRNDPDIKAIRDQLQPGDKLMMERTPGDMGVILHIERH